MISIIDAIISETNAFFKKNKSKENLIDYSIFLKQIEDASIKMIENLRQENNYTTTYNFEKDYLQDNIDFYDSLLNCLRDFSEKNFGEPDMLSFKNFLDKLNYQDYSSFDNIYQRLEYLSQDFISLKKSYIR